MWTNKHSEKFSGSFGNKNFKWNFVIILNIKILFIRTVMRCLVKFFGFHIKCFDCPRSTIFLDISKQHSWEIMELLKFPFKSLPDQEIFEWIYTVSCLMLTPLKVHFTYMKMFNILWFVIARNLSYFLKKKKKSIL